MSFLRKAVMLLNREFPTETLIKRGMRVGKDFNRQQGCFLDPTHCFLITIGDDVTMSIRVTVMAHDASTKKTLGYTKIGQVHIGNHVFIGAGSVVTHDIPARTVAAGVPAKKICDVDTYAERFQMQMCAKNTFGDAYRMGHGLDETKKKEILAATDGKTAFIK